MKTIDYIGKTSDETPPLSGGRSSRAAFELAWQGALNGGPLPEVENYVAGPDADKLRQQLLELDRVYRSLLTVRRVVEQSEVSAKETDFEHDSVDLSGQTIDSTPELQINVPTAVDQLMTVEVAGESAPSEGDEPIDNRAETLAAAQAGAPPGYEILSVLGRGGMGVVYKARQSSLKRSVALKMITAGAHAGPTQRARFQIEAEAVASLQHPNIVQIYEVGEHNGIPYFSLELVDGGTLLKKVKDHPATSREAAKLVESLSAAMHYAHQNGIVHRDLKLDNVLMSADGVPKITDFGLAKRTDSVESSQTQAGTILGTPSYMAPEQAMGDIQAVGAPADIYSLGAVLYHLLIGRPPFQAPTLLETLEMVRTQLPVPVRQLQPKVPRDLETICLKCLQKAPDRRYASADALARDLRHFLAGEPIEARPIGSVERLWLWCQRNPRVAALTATTFLLLIVGVIGSLTSALTIARERDQKELERKAADESRALAEARKNEADLANQLAQKNADEAMKQGRLALGAFGTLVDEVQKQIGDNPGTQDLKLKLLETALEGLEKVAKSDETSRLLGQSTAAAYMKMGQLFQQVGLSEKAFAQYQKCHEIIEALALKEPEGDVAQANLAATFTMLGEMSLELRRDMPASLDYYQKALAIRRQLNGRQLSDKLNPVQVKQGFAESCMRVGVTYLRLGEPERARAYFNEALGLREELAAANKDPMLQSDVAKSFNAIAEVDFRTRNWPAAKEQFAKALERNEQVQTANQTNPRYQLELALTLGNAGMFDLRTADLTAAEEHLSACLKLMQALAIVDPRQALYQRYLGLALYRDATLARKRNDSAAAERSNQACLEIRTKLAKDDPKNERRKAEWMLVLPRCGQHARAAEIAAEIQSGKSVDREVIVEVAQCLAQCAAATSGEKDLHERYLQRAVAALRQAVDLGYKDLVMLETDPDFDALRSDAGFQSLLAELKKAGTRN